jgi:hypothetical protein
LCRHDLAESAKSANFWLSGRHVADMSATFPAKTLMSVKFLRSFFGDWYLQRFLSVVSV